MSYHPVLCSCNSLWALLGICNLKLDLTSELKRNKCVLSKNSNNFTNNPRIKSSIVGIFISYAKRFKYLSKQIEIKEFFFVRTTRNGIEMVWSGPTLLGTLVDNFMVRHVMSPRLKVSFTLLEERTENPLQSFECHAIKPKVNIY